MRIRWRAVGAGWATGGWLRTPIPILRRRVRGRRSVCQGPGGGRMSGRLIGAPRLFADLGDVAARSGESFRSADANVRRGCPPGPAALLETRRGAYPVRVPLCGRRGAEAGVGGDGDCRSPAPGRRFPRADCEMARGRVRGVGLPVVDCRSRGGGGRGRGLVDGRGAAVMGERFGRPGGDVCGAARRRVWPGGGG